VRDWRSGLAAFSSDHALSQITFSSVFAPESKWI
jgi:hypothetical protein